MLYTVVNELTGDRFERELVILLAVNHSYPGQKSGVGLEVKRKKHGEKVARKMTDQARM